MTPPDLPRDDEPLDDDTLAVHAVVDDEATAEQRRRVARDPELVARVAALREVVAAVAEPVAPPPADVLADLRRRALDALDEPEEAPTAVPPEPAPAPSTPVRDLDAARTRRARRLPPFPAVAAVIVLLVVVGVGLLVAGTGGDDDSGDLTTADAGAEADGSDDAGGSDAAASENTTVDGEEDLGGQAEEARPADALRDDLLARATARYATEEALEADLRQVDVRAFNLAGSPGEAPDETEEGAASTTTAPPPTSLPSASTADGDALAFASDPVVTRCDDVLRAAEPDLGPAEAAVLVEVDGVPVLVLSNPTETSDQAPSGIRLTVLNAVDCSPRAAVLR